MVKRLFFILALFCSCFQVSAQTYDERITRAMDAVEKDSLYLAEQLLKDALNSDPANMKNALLLSNLGTIQRRMGKNKEAIESYTLAINKTPFSVTMLLNRASLYLEMDYTKWCSWSFRYITCRGLHRPYYIFPCCRLLF